MAEVNVREVALSTLLEMEREKEYSHVMVQSVLEKYDYFDTRDKAFLKRLLEGTIERKITLDAVINQVSKTPVQKMKPLIRSLMRMSAYQILYMDKVGPAAACNEAVKLAMAHKFTQLKGFVNGVLRTISREKESLLDFSGERYKGYSDIQRASITYSMPEQILKIWQQDYGKAEMLRMAEASLQVRPVYIRIREDITKAEKEKLIKALEETGVEVTQSSLLPYAYGLKKLDNLTKLPGFAEGLWTVQDVSSMFPAEVAGIKEGDFILDPCGAPGGKSMHAATKAGGKVQVEARDISEEKVWRMEENFSRMHLTQAKATCFDATVPDPDMLGKADVLFLDVPCSGLGIMGRKRDIKYHITEEGLESLIPLQREIIDTCIPYLKKGGVLIYSTCTVRKAENGEQVAYIMEKHGLTPESLDAYLPKELQDEDTKKGMLQLFPGKQDSDGFFVARLRKD